MCKDIECERPLADEQAVLVHVASKRERLANRDDLVAGKESPVHADFRHSRVIVHAPATTVGGKVLVPPVVRNKSAPVQVSGIVPDHGLGVSRDRVATGEQRERNGPGVNPHNHLGWLPVQVCSVIKPLVAQDRSVPEIT